MIKNINLQYIFSYIGIIPYLVLILDKTFFNEIQTDIRENFSIYYSIIIFVFIGALNWNLKIKITIFYVIYGIFPSIVSIFLILFNLFFYNIFPFLILFFLIQLILDYFYVYRSVYLKNIYLFLRLPLTFLIICSLSIIQL